MKFNSSVMVEFSFPLMAIYFEKLPGFTLFKILLQNLVLVMKFPLL